MNGGEAPLTYNQFQAIIASMDSPVPAVPTVTLEHLKNVFTPISEDHDEKYGVPTLFELGEIPVPFSQINILLLSYLHQILK